MLVYSPYITPRLQYIFDFVLRESLGLEFELTNDIAKFNSSQDQVKWSYGQYLEGIPSLPSANILFEKDISHQDTSKKTFENIITLFDVEKYDEIDFDIFGSAFYLISRYEEYLPIVKDKHGRYAGYQSIAYRYGFLEKAMVNRYIHWLAKWLQSNFSGIHLSIKKHQTLVSIDVDHPFYSKDVSLDKRILRSIKSMSLFQDKDKYDTFDFIIESLKGNPSIFFILCPESPTEMDHHNKRESDEFKSLIQKLKSVTKIGIHPSYYAESNKNLAEETNWLGAQIQKEVKSSRHHYLRFDIETSPRELINTGIHNDFSLAYGDMCGYRTSTSLPFYLFDLKHNKVTNLKIFSPCIMDSTFRYGSQSDFESHSQKLYDEVKTYGGYFIPIFHNDILAEEEWKEKFVDLIKLA